MNDQRDRRDGQMGVGSTNTSGQRGVKRWLWPILLLALLLLGLLWFVNANRDSARNETDSGNLDRTGGMNNGPENAGSNFAELEREFNNQFSDDDKIVLFRPDSTEFDNEANANEKLEAIAGFAKTNQSVKLQANGSIFNDSQLDSDSQLARQRAELVKRMLVDKGVNENSITVSALDNYEGQDEAARAAYARSVTMSVIE